MRQLLDAVDHGLIVSNLKLIETNSLRNIYEKANDMSDCGLMIAGPKGVGKTTSLYYLFHRLRETGALIVLSSASVMRTPSNTWRMF